MSRPMPRLCIFPVCYTTHPRFACLPFPTHLPTYLPTCFLLACLPVKVFSKTNAYLLTKGQPPVDWSVPE